MNNTLLPAYYGIPTLQMSDGYAAPGNENNGYSEIENIFEYGDNLKIIKGKHTFTLGADIRRGQLWNADGFVADGVLGFTGSYTASDPTIARNGTAGPAAGNSFADLLLGSPLSIVAPSPIGSDLFNLRGTEWNFFFEDDYRVTPRLTLNLGLRYEFPGGPGTFHSTNLFAQPVAGPRLRRSPRAAPAVFAELQRGCTSPRGGRPVQLLPGHLSGARWKPLPERP